MNDSRKKAKVLIIGAGVAGISAAMELTESGVEAILVEAAPHPGGRISSVVDGETGEWIDYGQHVLVGAYDRFLEILKKLGTYELLNIPDSLSINFLSKNGGSARLETGRLKGKAGLAFALLKFSLLGFRSRFGILRLFLKLQLGLTSPTPDMTAEEYLKQESQTEESFANFWHPLILATINAKASEASALLLHEVLKRSFFADASASRIIIPSVDTLKLIEPASIWLERLGSRLMPDSHTRELIFEGSHFKAAKLTKGGQIDADCCILALPSESLRGLKLNGADHLSFDFGSITHSPIFSCYMWYDRDFAPFDFAALPGSPIQWIFNRRRLCIADTEIKAKYPGHITVTISAAEEFKIMSDSEIIDIICGEIAAHIPAAGSARLLHHRLFKYMRATVRAAPSFVKNRPTADTESENLFLAGDWTDTGLPATIEGAAISGQTAAKKCLEYLSRRV